MPAEVISKKSACELYPMNSFFISLVRTWSYGLPDHWESGKLDAHTLDKFKVWLLWKIGKKWMNTGLAISSVCLKSIMEAKWSCSVMSNSLQPHGLYPTRLLHPWDFPGKSTGVGCHFLLQGIFPTQGLNPGLPHCRQTFYHLSHQRSQIWRRWYFSSGWKKDRSSEWVVEEPQRDLEA